MLLALLALLPQGFFAQNIAFKHLSTDNGLSQVSVNSVYIDERGLVWIATRDGLNCYNGQEMQTFRSEKDNPYSLSSSSVLRITGDRNGHLYLLTSGGISQLDLRTYQFKTLHQGKVDAMAFKDCLYIVCKNELLMFNASTGQFDSFFRMDGVLGNTSYIFLDSKKQFWIGTEHDGLYLLSSQKILHHKINKVRVSRIYEDSQGNVWAGTWMDGIYKFSPDGTSTNIRHRDNDPSSLSSDFVRCFCEDDQGNMWIGTMSGLECYNAQTDKFTCYAHDGRIPTSLSNSSVWCIAKDQQGTLWIGTYFGGVNYFNPEYEIYTIYRPSERESAGLSNPVVGNMIEDKDGRLWICTEGGGLNIFDRNTGRFTWYMHSAAANSLSHDNVKSIYYDSENDIMWIGTHLGGLNRLDIKKKRFTCYKRIVGDPESLPSDVVRDILPYKENLLIGTHDGVCLFYPQTGKCKKLFLDDKLGPFIKTVADLAFDKEGHLWMAVTGEGIFRYDFSTQELSQFKYQEGKSNTISSNNVNNILVDSRGMLWFSTSGSGLDCYDPVKRQFTNYDMKNTGMAGNSIYKACEIPNHELLLIFNHGFARFDYQTGQIRNYSVENGFPFTAINENGLYIANDHTVFLGGVDGMISFSLDKLDIAPKPYHIYWSKLVVNGHTVVPGDETGILKQSMEVTSEIRLRSSQNMFSLYFATSNYLLENKEDMEYFLEGFSKAWTATQGQPVITYTNLNPGTYTLKLRSAHSNSASQEISLKIVIRPPFYLTIWAYLLYIAAITGIIYFLTRTYKTRVKLRESLRYEKKHLQDIERLNHSKLRFFTSISHEFRTPLTLIVGQLEGILQMPQVSPAIFSKALTAYKSSMQLKSLISELLDFRKQEQGLMKIKVQQHDLIQFLNETYLLFVAYAQQKKIRLDFEKQTDKIMLWFDSVQMQKVINNLLSNAVKHCKADGRIVLSAYSEGEWACFSVEDNGIGIPAAEIDRIFDRFYQATNEMEVNAGTGIGLSLTKGIVTLHHGTIKVESVEGEKTKFIVRLPMGESAYTPEEKVPASETEKVMVSTPQVEELMPDGIWTDVPLSNVPAEGHASRPSILIVEDNEPIRHMLTALFEPFYQIETASDGVEAFEKITQAPPSIVLSDVLMPRMSGIELTRQLKSNLDTCHIPIVLLTARTEVEHNLEGLRTGADDYITKPFDSRILISRCNNLVNSRIYLQEYFSKQPAAQTPVLATNALDKQFLDEVIGIFERHLEDSDFTIDHLAQEMLISRTRVYSKIKAITGQTPNDFFTTLRLKKAAYLLRNNPEMNIISISEQVGFNTPRYFGKLFKKAYDMTPNEYRKGE